MIGNGSMIVFLVSSSVAILLMILFFVSIERAERRERMLDEELSYSEEKEEDEN